jgi:hypothetical protein
MRLLATLAVAALAWGGVSQAGPTRGPAEVPTGLGSNYAAAKAACARQGQRVKLVATQTTDKTLDSRGVSVTAVCVPGAAVVKAKAVRKKAPAKR